MGNERVRLAYGLERVGVEPVPVSVEEPAHRIGADRGDRHIARNERARGAGTLDAHHARVCIDPRDRPCVGRRLAPHRDGQVRCALEGERDPFGPEIDGLARLDEVLGRRAAECAVFVDGGEDEHPEALPEIPDDGDTGGLDTERRDIQPEHLGIVHRLPGGFAVEAIGGDEQLRHRFGRDASVFEIARLFVGLGRPLEQALHDVVEFGRGRDDDRNRAVDRGPHLGGERMVRHPDHVGPVFRTGQRLVQRREQDPADGSLRILGSDRLVPNDEAGRRLPDHERESIRLIAIVDVYRWRKPSTDPLVARYGPAPAFSRPALSTSRHQRALPPRNEPTDFTAMHNFRAA